MRGRAFLRLLIVFLLLHLVLLYIIWTTGLPSTAQAGAHSSFRPPRTLLTLVTTLVDSPDRRELHMHTLSNWGSFWPQVQPVLVCDSCSSLLRHRARRAHWVVLPAGTVRRNRHGTPRMLSVMRDIFTAHAQKSTWAGYANADILFDRSLLHTLKHVSHGISIGGSTILSRRPILVTGLRYDVSKEANLNMTFNDMQLHENTNRHYGFGMNLQRHNAFDYFMFHNQKLFPWKHFPAELVIGRPDYDPLLIGLALANDVTVIDASKTLAALHLSPQTGSAVHTIDYTHNRDVIDKSDVYRTWRREGEKEFIPLQTAVHFNGSMILVKTQK